jgi:hypothetical protein
MQTFQLMKIIRKGLVIFTIVNLFNFTQILLKHIVTLNKYWCNEITHYMHMKHILKMVLKLLQQPSILTQEE